MWERERENIILCIYINYDSGLESEYVKAKKDKIHTHTQIYIYLLRILINYYFSIKKVETLHWPAITFT